MSTILKEKKIVESMIKLYCRHSEKNETLCNECSELIKYANARLDACRYGELKTPCKRCPTHCYRPVMREKIKQIMRFSGPRMLIYHPIISIKHLL